MNKMVVVVKGIIFHNGKVLLVQRAKNDKIGGGTWECAGGKIEFGEDLTTALRREIKEEAGLDVTVGKILYATTFKTDPTRQVVVITYLCGSSDNFVTLSEEHTAYIWVSKEEIKGFLKSEIIKDFEKNHVFALEDWG